MYNLFNYRNIVIKIVNINLILFLPVYILLSIYTFVRTRFVTTRNNVGFARKKVQTISFIERGFKRLGLGHKTVVFRGVHT